jgi:hypothetical protein
MLHLKVSATRASRVVLLIAVLTLFLALFLQSPVVASFSPNYYDCGYGLVTYSGTVYNSNSPSSPQQYVVVSLVTHPLETPGTPVRPQPMPTVIGQSP